MPGLAHSPPTAESVGAAFLAPDFCSRQQPATPVTILVTMRSETPAPDPIVALWKDTVAERFEIQALSRAEVAALVDAALGGQVDGSAAQTLWRLAQGNPLYLRELILGGLDSGNLGCTAGV